MSNDIESEIKAKVTAEKLEAAVRKFAKANPDYIYKTPEVPGKVPSASPYTYFSSCYYTGIEDEKYYGSCIFGRAFEDLGVDLQLLSNLEGHAIDEILYLSGVCGGGKLQWFADVQAGQDTGKPWATAVRDADNPWATAVRDADAEN